MSPHLSDFPVAPARVTGLGPARTILDNGVVVLVKESRKSPAVTIQLGMKAGSICDPAGHVGATLLLGKVIDRGTVTKSAADIAEGLEDRGAALAINVTRHLTTIVCTCLAEDFDTVLALLGDIVMAPSIPDAELAIQKGEVVTLIRQDEDNPAIRAIEGLMALLYGASHPYGRPSKGTVDTVEHVTRDLLLQLHAERFAPSELMVAIVGDVADGHAITAVQRTFGSWHRAVPAAVVLPAVIPQSSRRQIVLPMMNKAQTDIAYGFTTLTRSDPDYYAFWLLHIALGYYAMGGRLGENIRERQGMAYYASSTFDANVLPGPFVVRAGVSADNVERTIRAIDDELRKMAAEGITERELFESRQYLIGSMPRALETNAGIAQFLITCELFSLGIDYDTRLPGMLNAITRDQVLALSRRYLDPDRASLVIAGPYEGR